MKWLGMALAGLMLLGLVGCKKKPPEETTIFPSEPITTPAPAPTPTAAAPAEAAKMVYTCSMHPDVEQAEPGECPQCKMLLHAKVPEGTQVEYYCPSHPDAVQGGAGQVLPVRDVPPCTGEGRGSSPCPLGGGFGPSRAWNHLSPPKT